MIILCGRGDSKRPKCATERDMRLAVVYGHHLANGMPQVGVMQAPVKTMARMQEKVFITRYSGALHNVFIHVWMHQSIEQKL